MAECERLALVTIDRIEKITKLVKRAGEGCKIKSLDDVLANGIIQKVVSYKLSNHHLKFMNLR